MRENTGTRYIKWAMVLFCFIISLNIFMGCSKEYNSSKAEHDINEQYKHFKIHDISGLSEDEIVIEIKKANEIEEILNQNKYYQSSIMHENVKEYDGLIEVLAASYNNDKLNGSFSFAYVGNQEIFLFQSGEVYRFNSDNNTFSRKIYFNNHYENKKASLMNCSEFLSSPYEKVKSIEKTGDNIIVHTGYDLSKENEGFKKSYGISDGVVKITYTVNPSTLIMKEKKADCLLLNETQKELYRTIFYYLSKPEKLTPKVTLDDIIAKKNRNFTVVFNPKTKQEESKTFKVKCGLNVIYDLPEGYHNAYRNEACTDIYNSSATNDDETIYFMKGK
jgi:hypothetical protein